MWQCDSVLLDCSDSPETETLIRFWTNASFSSWYHKVFEGLNRVQDIAATCGRDAALCCNCEVVVDAHDLLDDDDGDDDGARWQLTQI